MVQWAARMSLILPNIIDVATDINDDVYIAGISFGATQVFSANNTGTAGNISLPSGGYVVLAKYDNNGNALWATIIGPTAFQPTVATDTVGNVYIAGQSPNLTSTFYTSGNTSTPVLTLTYSVTNGGTFVAKYNTAGVFQWATIIDGNNTSFPYGIITDSVNNVYVTGEYFDNTLTIFNAGNTTSTPDYTLTKFGSAFDGYLIKYNSNGLVQWATHFTSTDVAQGMDVGVDALNNVYVSALSDTGTVTGFYNAGNTSTSPNVAIETVQAGSFNQYIAKYTDAGVVQWASHITCLIQEILATTIPGLV